MDVIRRVLRSRKKQLLSLDNVIGVGLGYKSVRDEVTERKSIVVIVEKKVPSDELRRRHVVPPFLDGVDTDVIETGKFRFLGRTDRVRPVPPGVSIGHIQVTAGTFGAVVRDKSTGKLLILSNNHVLANATNGRDKRAKAGDPILQPGVYDNGKRETDVIGSLLKFVPINPIFEESQCPVAQKVSQAASWFLKGFLGRYRLNFQRETLTENVVDAAVAEPLRDDLIVDSVLELGKISGVGEAQLGQTVRKSGRTSGLTEGKVRTTDVTIRVDMGNGGEAVFTDQIMADMVSRPGDSGSVILNENNQAVGLLFAGSYNMTLFNKFSTVQRMLDVTL
ncbi:MAG TPA: hypothetical protein GX691_07720 [Clostridia bacterium]|jgi:hypothetical protein|nr:hypothetical protein [Clostridia bacterium]